MELSGCVILLQGETSRLRGTKLPQICLSSVQNALERRPVMVG